MSKASKKEIRQFIRESGNQILRHYKVASPSKKSEKILANFSRKFAEEIKTILKKDSKVGVKKTKNTSRKKVTKKATVKTKAA